MREQRWAEKGWSEEDWQGVIRSRGWGAQSDSLPQSENDKGDHDM
jgi:hypothetical protein